MKNLAFKGWKHIFDFSWKQAVAAKGFKFVTVLVAVIMLVVGAAVPVIMAFVQEDSAQKVSPIETVHIVDESGLQVLFTDEFAGMYGERYAGLAFEAMDADWQQTNASLGEENPNDLVLHITAQDEGGYLLTAIIPFGSALTQSDAEDFLDDFLICVEQSKLLSSGVEASKLVYAMSGVSSELVVAGEEEKSVGEELAAMLLPLLIVLVLYMMTLLYGQSITNVVSIEKTSKLMEMILTMARPEALIFGKVLATFLAALMQLGLWIVCLVGGFFGGDFVAKELIYPEFENILLEVFKLMQNQDGSTAFTIGAAILSIAAMAIGFLFYCSIASLVASFASKSEEVATCASYYQLVVIAGFFGSYMLPLQESDLLNTIIRIVPVTSAFILPGDILVGNVTVWMGALYLLLLFGFTLGFVYFAGRTYKAQVLNRGNSIFDRMKKKKA